jgi:uncharacterized membrane protein
VVRARWPLTRRRFLARLDRPRVERAIAEAETATSGEIRVAVTGFFRGELRALGEGAWRRMKMDETRHRNGVLILLAPTRRQVLILGDAGIHAQVGDPYWAGLARALGARFESADFTSGLVDAIRDLGGALARHFPPDPGENRNELPNSVDVGPSTPARTRPPRS